MIKKGKILTGGNISEHYPLGADNSALYSWAATFLKNLDLKDKSYSRYFAVPETNKTGSRIDWYCNGAYYQGDPLIVPWENADEPERAAALAELDGMMDGLAKMAERLRSKPGLSADMKLFVQFIAGDPEKGTGPMALETPGKKFIYIVEGHPVLTFWGFTEKGVETAGSDPFYFLRTPKAPEPAPAPAPEPAPAPAPAPAPEPAPAPAPAPGHEPAPEPAPATETKVKRKGFWALLPAWLWWILLPLLLLLLLLLLWFFLLKPFFFPAPALSPLPQISAPLQDGGSEDKAAVQPEEPQEEATEESAPEEKPDPERTDVINSVQPGAAAGTAGSAAPDGGMPSGNAPEAAPDAEQPVNPDAAPGAEQPAAPADQGANPDAAANADQGADTGAAPAANGAVNPDAARNGANAPDSAAAAAPQGQAGAAPDGRTAAAAADGADQGTKPVKPIPRPMKAEALRNSVMTPGSELSADSGLRDEKHRAPIKMNFKWNGDGTGEEVIRKADGTECRGPVMASRTGGNVSISPSGSIACTDGSSFRAQKIDCHADSSGNSRCAMSGNGGRSVPVVLSDGKKQGAGK